MKYLKQILGYDVREEGGISTLCIEELQKIDAAYASLMEDYAAERKHRITCANTAKGLFEDLCVGFEVVPYPKPQVGEVE